MCGLHISNQAVVLITTWNACCWLRVVVVVLSCFVRKPPRLFLDPSRNSEQCRHDTHTQTRPTAAKTPEQEQPCSSQWSLVLFRLLGEDGRDAPSLPRFFFYPHSFFTLFLHLKVGKFKIRTQFCPLPVLPFSHTASANQTPRSTSTNAQQPFLQSCPFPRLPWWWQPLSDVAAAVVEEEEEVVVVVVSVWCTVLTGRQGLLKPGLRSGKRP